VALEEEVGSVAGGIGAGILADHTILRSPFAYAQRETKPPQQLGVAVSDLGCGTGAVHRQSESRMPAMAGPSGPLTGGGGLNAFFPQNLSMSFPLRVLENRIAGVSPRDDPRRCEKSESNP